MNYFSHKNAAERYLNGRPHFHKITINRIKKYLMIEEKLNSALDIACGTGLSTQELLNIATNVFGTDSSQAMLDFAILKDKINYQFANAEMQPFIGNTFDLITVCSGIHWFNIDEFLLEANRLLKNKSWLILYDNFFLGKMEGNEEFKKWYNTIYLENFPAPKRNDTYIWNEKNLERKKFQIVHEEEFKNVISFNINELILYFTTQSNIISKVENSGASFEEVENWLILELSKFFKDEISQKLFHFGNWIKYLQKV